MNSSVELKEEITFDEFKAWMNGLLRGTGKSCPGAEDWRAIYKMMDKVVPDQVEVPQYQPQFVPYVQPMEWQEPFKIGDPIITPTYVGDPVPNPWEVTCSYNGSPSSVVTGLLAATSGANSIAIGTNNGYGGGCYGGYSVPQDVSATIEITSSTPLMTSTIAPSVVPFEENEKVKELFENIEEVRQEMYKLTGIKGKE